MTLVGLARCATLWAAFLATTGCQGPAVKSAFPGLPLFAEGGSWQDADAAPTSPDDGDAVEQAEQTRREEDSEGYERHGVLHHLLYYIPNRVFDVFDMLRARFRVGPGIALDVRATELADVFLGTYASIWVGIHGPRGEPSIPWPVGLETLTGAEISVAEASIDGGGGPGYGMLEFGVGAQVLLFGFDVGVDPLEIVDFIVGFVFIDLAGDDY